MMPVFAAMVLTPYPDRHSYDSVLDWIDARDALVGKVAFCAFILATTGIGAIQQSFFPEIN